MNCERFEALLWDYLEGMLNGEDAAAMEKHAGECANCARKLSDMRLLLQDLSSLDSPAQVPAEWRSGWREAVRREEKATMQKQTPKETIKRKPWRAWLSAAAAVAVLAAGSLAARDWVPKSGGPQTADSGAAMMKAANYGSAAGNSWALDEAPAPAPSEAARGSLTFAAPQNQAVKTEEPQGAQTPNGVKIIRTASYSLATMAFQQDFDAVKDLAAAHGGWVEYSSVTGDAARGDLRYASLTLRIPTESLNAFQSGIASVGRVTSLNESAQDVSESYSDTQMRLVTQREKLARLQKLMETAGELADLLSVENEIANTQYQIDSYESTLKGLDSRVDFSRVQVSLREETAGQAAAVTNLTLGERLIKGLTATFEAIGDFLQNLAVFLVMALPVALPLLLVLFLLIKARKRRKLKRQQQGGNDHA